MQNKKYFIITIDTEADNQWVYDNPISTENTIYLPRFQELCEKYDFKPVWLTTYEMANDERFVKYFKEKQDSGKCEIGMHLHGWSTPPEYELSIICKERPFIYEYPTDIIEQKVKSITECLTEKFGKAPVSHRAGRWAIDDEYLRILQKYGYKIDCSVTPGINWGNTKGQTGKGGPDFSKFNNNIKLIEGIYEVPVTIENVQYFNSRKLIPNRHLRSWLYALVDELRNYKTEKQQWLRPDCLLCFNGLKLVVDSAISNGNEYIMFMIHSSELMPGGSPTFSTQQSIDLLYKLLLKLFDYIKKHSYEGITLRDFNNILKEGHYNV